MPTRGHRSQCVVIAIVAISALVTAWSAPATTEPRFRSTPCGPVAIASADASKLTVVGNHVEYADGRVFVPYGISLVSGPETTAWARSEKAAVAQIIAAGRFWHANTVRIQVSEAQLLDKPTPGHRYNVAFAASVNRLVCRILRQGQIPVVNDTTLFTAAERGPTQRSVRFWRFMSQRYGNRLPLIFDLFDEPRLGRNPITNRFVRAGWVWHLWERGGSLGGKRYLGMQKLVDTIRIRQHVHNVIWVEEPWYLDPDKLPTSRLPRHLLRGRDIVYAFHKVALDERSPSFEALAAVAAKGIPLVDSEWSQFAATRRPWECQDRARSGVPGFRSVLARGGAGPRGRGGGGGGL